MFILDIVNILKGFLMFTGAYSNNVFKKPLNEEEEKKYLEQLKNGDNNARNMLIEHNLRLVAHIVKKYEIKNNDTDDLISIGTIGLIKGIDSFKHDQNVKLTTYVARCIENEILMYFRKTKKNDKDVSLSEPLGFDKDGNEMTLIDILQVDQEDFSDSIHTKDNIKLASIYMKNLTHRETEIIIDRYGLNNNDELTQKDIAKKFNISRSYVSRIEKRALTKMLKEFIKSNNQL
ncbi:MAG: RNA polymerase sporulation sigma factor SigK [Bacilli bacterium]